MLLEKKFQQHIVDMTRAWRNSAGKYDWHDSEYTVRAAASLAGDMGLSEENMMMFPSDRPSYFFGQPHVTGKRGSRADCVFKVVPGLHTR